MNAMRLTRPSGSVTLPGRKLSGTRFLISLILLLVAGCITPGGVNQPIANPLCRYQLNDNAESPVTVDSMGAVNGTASKNTSGFHGNSENPPDLNGAFRFNYAAHDVVRCSPIDPQRYNGGLSFGGWVYWNGHTTLGVNPFYGWDYSSSWGAVYIACGSDGSLVFRFGTGSPSGHHTVTNQITTGAWYHLFATHGPGGDTLYKNGVVCSNFPSGVLFGTTSNFKIGSVNEGSQKYHDGSLADIRIYTNVLTAAEVSALYSTGRVHAKH